MNDVECSLLKKMSVCQECVRLKTLEDKHILALGTYQKPHGLNERNEIRGRVRTNFNRQ